MTQWEINARIVAKDCGSHVNWEDRFYICPECGKPIYECDYDEEDFVNYLCPICELMPNYEHNCEDWDEPVDLECGFDPYMGDYSYDC